MRKWLTRVGLIAFGLGIGLMMVLAGLRLLGQEDPLGAIPRFIHQATCHEAEGNWRDIYVSVVIDTSEPCASFPWPAEPGGEFYNHVIFNNYGLHDTILTLEKPDDVFRIMIIGDSFPEGIQVPLRDGFPYLLEQALNEQSETKIEVINFSKAAVGTDRELLMYASLGWRFDPDLVILSVFMGNDIMNNEMNLEPLLQGYRGNRPFFTLDDGGNLQLHDSHIPLDRNLFPDALAYQWLITMKDNQQPAPEPDTLTWNSAYPVGAGLYLPEDAYWARGWAVTQALILRMQKVVKNDGVPFAVLVIPDRHAIHPEFWDALAEKVPPIADRDPLAPHQRMIDFLQANHVPTLDLAPGLIAAATADPDTHLYFPVDSHFTEAGHRITAAALVDWLHGSGLIPR